jgi:hypothetical protein
MTSPRRPLLPARSSARRLTSACVFACAASLSLTACDPDDVPLDTAHLRTSSHAVLMDDLPWISGPYPDNLINGLSRQLVDEINCIQPGVLVPFELRQEVGYLYTTRTIPLFLRPEVKAAAEGAARANNDYLTFRSAYRDVAMQYYDWRWGQIYSFAAARPGSSRHQGGQAIDVEYHAFWRPKLLAYGWTWPYGDADQPHFEWVQNSTPDLMVESVRAFQRLWNRNNPNDLISEDGSWGPQSEARMQQSHAEGFTFGGCDTDRDGVASSLISGADCDDTRADVNPSASEVCGDNIDQDCSGADLSCAQPDADTSDASDTSTTDDDTSTTAADTSTTTTDTSATADDTSTTAADTSTTTDDTSTDDTSPTADDTSASTSGTSRPDTAPPPPNRLQSTQEDDCQCSQLQTPASPSPLSSWRALWLLSAASVLASWRRRATKRQPKSAPLT